MPIAPIRKIFVTVSVLFSAIVAGPGLTQADPIGSVTRIKGEAFATDATAQRTLKSGDAVNTDETLSTGSGARLEVTFIDESVLTLGEKARLTVDNLVFDPSASASTLTQSVHVLAGNFRMRTGRIGKADPDNVSITTPVATIGIRGTDFIGGPVTASESEGGVRYGFVLLDGAVQVLTVDGAVTLDEPGEGTFLPLDGIGAPSEPSIWPEATRAQAVDSVSFE